MGDVTKIQWTDHTFNPWIGCTKVSDGCKFCYADAQDHRWGHDRWGPGKERTRTSPVNWKKPLQWNELAKAEGCRHRVFCASMADVFDSEVPHEWRADIWRLIHETTWLDWQLLTKRPENVSRMLPFMHLSNGWPWGNVWIGTSVEDQAAAEKRIPELLRVPAQVRFLSCEPLIGRVDLQSVVAGNLRGVGIDWVIVGGESGPKARPMEAAWARSLVRQCRRGGVAVFVKQMGSNVEDRNDAGFSGDDEHGWHSAVEYGGEIRVEHLDEGYQGAPVRVHLRDRKGGDPAEWPQDLNVRQFPEVRR